MNAIYKKIITLSCFFILSWSNVGCSESLNDDLVKSANSPEANQQIQKGSANPIDQRGGETEAFPAFYTRFSAAIQNDDWLALAELTKFPFTFRGQLDMEGEIKVSKQRFLSIFPEFLELETFIQLGGEEFSTTYRVLAITPVDEYRDIGAEKAEVHDFVFSQENGRWRFVQVYTDLNNIEQREE